MRFSSVLPLITPRATVKSMMDWFRTIKNYALRIYRILWNSITSFARNEDVLKASALTYYTLISIVPFFAVAIGIATGFGFQDYLEREMKNVFHEQKQVMDYVIHFAHTMLENAQGSVIAGVGLIALFWTNISLLNSIEEALNDIWKVRQPRSWAKKITDYLAAMVLCPIFLVVSSSLSVFIISQITHTAHENRWVELVSPYILFLFRFLPFVLSILLFVVIYLFIPNTKIQMRPRIIAGILAGIAFQLWQWIYIRIQVEISSYNAIYGTFAAFPLFLLWLQVSWLIVLAGAETAVQIENEMTVALEPGTGRPVKISEKELGLLILQRCIDAYSRGEPPMTTIGIAQELGIPALATQQIINVLEDGGILLEVSDRSSSQIGYQPSRDARLFTILGVCQAIEKQVGWNVTVEDNPTLEKISRSLRELEQAAAASHANRSFNELI